MVVEERADDRVHLALVVASPGLELERDPFEDDPPLRGLRGDLGEAAVPEEGPEHGLLVLVRRAERDARVPGRPDLLGGPSKRFLVEPVAFDGRAEVGRRPRPRDA